MTSIDRTAYPRFTRHLSQRELKSRYAVTPDEHHFIFQVAKSSSGRLTLAILLKARQQLGYFPSLSEVPLAINAHLANLLGEPENTSLPVIDSSEPPHYVCTKCYEDGKAYILNSTVTPDYKGVHYTCPNCYTRITDPTNKRHVRQPSVSSRTKHHW